MGSEFNVRNDVDDVLIHSNDYAAVVADTPPGYHDIDDDDFTLDPETTVYVENVWAVGRTAIAAEGRHRRNWVTERINEDDAATARDARRAPYLQAVVRRFAGRDLSSLTDEQRTAAYDQAADIMADSADAWQEYNNVAGGARLTERSRYGTETDTVLARARQLSLMRARQPDETSEAREAYARYIAEEIRLNEHVQRTGIAVKPPYRPGDEIADSNDTTLDLTETVLTLRGMLEHADKSDSDISPTHPYFVQAYADLVQGNPGIDPTEATRLATIHASVRLRGEALAAEQETPQPTEEPSTHQRFVEMDITVSSTAEPTGNETTDQLPSFSETATALQAEAAAAEQQAPPQHGFVRTPTIDPAVFDAAPQEEIAEWRGAATAYHAMLDGSDLKQNHTDVQQVAADADEDDLSYLLQKMRQGTWSEPGSADPQ